MRVLIISTDFDECEKYYDNSCFYNAECINTPGSYYCRCPDGYRYDDRKKRCKGKLRSVANNLLSKIN